MSFAATKAIFGNNIAIRERELKGEDVAHEATSSETVYVSLSRGTGLWETEIWTHRDGYETIPATMNAKKDLDNFVEKLQTMNGITRVVIEHWSADASFLETALRIVNLDMSVKLMPTYTFRYVVESIIRMRDEIFDPCASAARAVTKRNPKKSATLGLPIRKSARLLNRKRWLK